MPHRDSLQLPVACLLATIATVSLLYSGHFGKELIAEIAILAIFAMSLDLLVGGIGLVSLGHAGFLAIGAYATAAATTLWGWPPIASFAMSVVLSAIIAAVVGVLAIRLSGVFFIMITLAIGQMFYAYFFKAQAFGGDDGMAGTPRVDLSFLGIDSSDPTVFSAILIVITAAIYLFLLLIKQSPFGMTLSAIRQNESRMSSLGCPVQRYKLVTFITASAIASLAGSLMAQHTGFVSPDLAFWTVSGQVLIIVIIGGSGSLIGPVAAAALFILLRNVLNDGLFWEKLSLPSEISNHWQLFMGIFFIAIVLLTKNGLYGCLAWTMERLTFRQRRPR